MYLLLLVSITFLLYNNEEELFALFLKDGHIGPGFLQLTGHCLNLLTSLVDLVQPVLQLVGRITQLLTLLIQQPNRYDTASLRRSRPLIC